MFIFLKLVKPLLLPATLLFIGFILVFALFRRRQRLARILLLVLLVIYYVLSIQPTAYMLSRNLESKLIQAPSAQMSDAELIVVLAGGANKQEGIVPFGELSGASLKRLWRGIQVYRQLDGTIPMLYSGGSGDPFDPVSIEAELAKQYAISVGIPEEQFWVEHSSRDTYESGVAIVQLLEERFPEAKEHRIALVTSAWHMPRAYAVMRNLGLQAIPTPADFSPGVLKITPLSFLPAHSYFSASTVSIQEWIGIVGYKVRGRI